MTSALIEGDPGGAFHLVRDLMAQGVPFDVVLFDMVATAFADFGTRWQTGDYRIADEHAATGAVESLVAMLAGSFDLPDEGDDIVIAAAQGDHHSLPGRLTAAYLLSEGYRVRYLGSNVDAADLAGYLTDESPQALILSCAVPTLLPGARACVEASHGVGVPVLAGGKGFGPDGVWAYAVGADSWVASPREVVDVLGSWEPDTEAAELVVPPPPADLDLIERHRSEVVAAALGHLEAPPHRLRDEIDLLLAAVQAALLVDDPVLLSQFTRWQTSVLSAHGFGDKTAAQLHRALGAGLRELAPDAAEWLATAGPPGRAE